MAKCPNCGQTTARTGDWACQWCGYPLLSGSYRQLPKTYRQLKEENLPRRVAAVGDEPEPVVEPEPVAELEPVAEPEPVAELEPVPEREPVVEPKPVAEPEPVAELEPVPEPEPVAELEPVPEPEPVAKAEPAPAVIELTVAELLSAYLTEGGGADARFANKILKVTGIVDRIEVKDNLDIQYINLSGTDTNVLQHVRCVFGKEYRPELNRLTRGQAVTVQGKYDGSIIDISMRDCVLVH